MFTNKHGENLLDDVLDDDDLSHAAEVDADKFQELIVTSVN